MKRRHCERSLLHNFFSIAGVLRKHYSANPDTAQYRYLRKCYLVAKFIQITVAFKLSIKNGFHVRLYCTNTLLIHFCYKYTDCLKCFGIVIY